MLLYDAWIIWILHVSICLRRQGLPFMCCFPISNGESWSFFPVLLRRHVYLRGALPPPGTEGYFLLTDEEDRSQIKGKPLTQSHPTKKVSSWHDSNHYLFGGYLELQGCTGTFPKLLMLLLLNSLVLKVLGKEAKACHQINVVWLRWLRRCLALSSEQLHGQWITKVYCDCWIAHL